MIGIERFIGLSSPFTSPPALGYIGAMAGHPVLILQMQRMGDLILTFPLALWLTRLAPGRPVWVVGEQAFFSELMPLSPNVAYLPWEKAAELEGLTFDLCLNLCHRPEAAALAGRIVAERTLGPVQGKDGVRYVQGAWQLYRASLVDNNRHNRFHWADLNGLDIAPLALIAGTTWNQPRALSEATGRVGLFLGASQDEKRPPAAFWAELVAQLVRRGLTPVLLGGTGEVELAARVTAQATAPCLNLCGRFKLNAFASSLATLDLLVTPDTGPMHLAAWVGLPCLNLSMGPVNPWETGPYQPGHHVLQAAMSCTGCWRCTHPVPYACRAKFHPGRVAFLAHRLARGKSPDGVELPGLRLGRTGRNADGLYHLEWGGAAKNDTSREAVAAFWYAYWGASFGLWDEARVAYAWAGMGQAAPAVQQSFRKAVRGVGARFALALRNPKARVLDPDFWTTPPPLLRPLTGYLHLLLQNADYGDQGFRDSLELIERLASLLG